MDWGQGHAEGGCRHGGGNAAGQKGLEISLARKKHSKQYAALLIEALW